VLSKAQVKGKTGTGGHSRWVNIKVPRALLAAIANIKRDPREAHWVAISRAITGYAGLSQEWDRRFWYMFKVINGWTYVKTAFELEHRGLADSAFTRAQRDRFIETLREVKARVKAKSVDSAVAAVISALEKIEKPSGRDVAAVNDLVKQLCQYIMALDGVD